MLLRLDDLLGKRLHDREGRLIGRIHDMRAEERDGELVLVEYHVGIHALWQRIGFHAWKLIGGQLPEPRKIPWDRVDLSDPENPVLSA